MGHYKNASGGSKDVTAAGTAEQLTSTSTPVPIGTKLVILAKMTNAGDVKIGYTAAVAEGATPLFVLKRGQYLRIAVDNANIVYLDVTVSGEGVYWFTEQA